MADDLASLQEDMKALTGAQRIEAETKALRRVGQIIKGWVKELAPVRDEDMPSGTALAPEELRNGYRSSVRVSKGPEDPPSHVTIYPIKEVEHVAGWVENGHWHVEGGYLRDIGTAKERGPGTKTSWTEAYPFVRPAADICEDQAVEAYVEIMSEEIERMMNGG